MEYPTDTRRVLSSMSRDESSVPDDESLSHFDTFRIIFMNASKTATRSESNGTVLPTEFVTSDQTAELTQMLELELGQTQQVAGGLARAIRCCACHCCSCH